MSSRVDPAALTTTGCDVRFDNLTRQLYATDASIYQIVPLAVAFPRNAREASAIVRAAAAAGLPITPRGAGTGQAGGSMAPAGGIVLDLSGWKEIEQIHPEDFQAFVRPGVTLDELNKALAPHGFYLPPDPSSGAACTLGGMVATIPPASGP